MQQFLNFMFVDLYANNERTPFFVAMMYCNLFYFKIFFSFIIFFVQREREREREGEREREREYHYRNLPVQNAEICFCCTTIENFIGKLLIVFIILFKTLIWVHVRIASPRRF